MRTVPWIVPLIVALLGTVLWFPISGHGRWLAVLLNVGHGFVFALVAILCAIGLRSIVRSSPFGLYAMALGLAVGLGGAVELLQYPIGRDADLLDVGRDALGAWAGLAGFVALDAEVSPRRRLAAMCCFVVPAWFLAVPAVECVAAYLRRAAEFPVLADFSRRDDRYFLDTPQSSILWDELPEQWSRGSAERALRVTFVGGPYAGVDFIEPVADWTAYREMVIELLNPGAESLPVVLRVHDSRHDQRYEDRYNRTFVLAPEERTTLAIPLEEIRRGPRNRDLDMTNVAGFMLFVSILDGSSAPAQELFLSRIWLR